MRRVAASRSNIALGEGALLPCAAVAACTPSMWPSRPCSSDCSCGIGALWLAPATKEATCVHAHWLLMELRSLCH